MLVDSHYSKTFIAHGFAVAILAFASPRYPQSRKERQ
jgi:hypothetical protein